MRNARDEGIGRRTGRALEWRIAERLSCMKESYGKKGHVKENRSGKDQGTKHQLRRKEKDGMELPSVIQNPSKKKLRP